MDPIDQNDDQELATDDERTTVDITEEPDDEGGDEGDQRTAGDRETRDEKKRNRKRLRDELEEARRQNQTLTDRLNRSEHVQQDIQRQLAETRTQIGRAQDRGDDPLETELKDVRRRLQSLATTAARLGDKGTKEEFDDLQRQAEELRDKELDLVTERKLRQMRPAEDPQAGTRQALRGMYPDVYANPKALGWAKGRFQQIIAEKGEPANEAEAFNMAKQAFDESKRQFRIGQPPPSEDQRRKFDGMPRGGAGSGGKGKVTEVTMEKHDERMANAAYPHIKDKNVRMQMWAKKAGKRLAEKQRAGRR